MMGRDDVGPVNGGKEIARFLARFFPQIEDQRRHLFINAVVQEQQADRATVYSNIIITGAKDGVVSVRSSGFYRLRMAKVGAQWLIEDLFAGFDTPW